MVSAGVLSEHNVLPSPGELWNTVPEASSMSEADQSSAAQAAARAFGFHAAGEDGLDGDFGIATEYPDQLDYYSLLGLSQKPAPTEAEIRSAYRNLTLMFHPDKQPPHLRESAEQHFKRIQTAYDTLMDTKKRVVYDILGEEGVQREWGRGGAMGRGGDAEKQQVGVKAMSPQEFRRWFTRTMKRRERKALQDLVNSHGSITLGLNAETTIRVDEDDDMTIHIPERVVPVSYAAKVSFDSPLSLPSFRSNAKADTIADEQKTDPDSEQDDEVSQSPVQVTFQAGIAGNIVHRTQEAKAEFADGTEEDIKIPLPPVVVANNVNLGVNLKPNMTELIGTKGIWKNRYWSTLRESTVLVEANVLPLPLLRTTVARAFQPIPGIKPFQVTTKTTLMRSLLESPPSLEVHVTKEIAERKLAFCAWSSGTWYYPDFLLDNFFFRGMTVADMYAFSGDLSSLQVGLISLPKQTTQTISMDDDDVDVEEESAARRPKNRADSSAESWQTFIQVSPGGGGLSLMYSRNLFSGTPADDLAKSEWTEEGYSPVMNIEGPRAVRVELTTTVSPDLSFTWNLKGTRRVGEFTRMGLGIGLTHQGILMTVGWTRLGQSLNLPLVLCSKDEATHDAAILAGIFTWASYLAIEFGYIRPRDRKLRREQVARRHNQLKKLIPKKRGESEQAIQMMTDQVRRRQLKEHDQDGLVIDRAEYGYWPPTDRKPRRGLEEARVADVLYPVANLVERGQLVIRPSTVKHQIIGFHDPAPLLKKQLKIWYTFQGRSHYVEVGDKDGVLLPQRGHMCPESEQFNSLNL
ncbi:Uncharacterized protein PECH_005292 [Penicillium ucsense]|uniref:J domain-containing protein n=1 Tax=Penicillium ucsense TaxID=2839758 RepID=A0A8J8W4E6_9EURO|nr:Uncharacterized protein PECM_005719 [Penicillium ucsense]KAF7736441.1 Uncharacterized protein PECH_005292 [Penicillium ucsense]